MKRQPDSTGVCVEALSASDVAEFGLPVQVLVTIVGESRSLIMPAAAPPFTMVACGARPTTDYAETFVIDSGVGSGPFKFSVRQAAGAVPPRFCPAGRLPAELPTMMPSPGHRAGAGGHRISLLTSRSLMRDGARCVLRPRRTVDPPLLRAWTASEPLHEAHLFSLGAEFASSIVKVAKQSSASDRPLLDLPGDLARDPAITSAVTAIALPGSARPHHGSTYSGDSQLRRHKRRTVEDVPVVCGVAE